MIDGGARILPGAIRLVVSFAKVAKEEGSCLHRGIEAFVLPFQNAYGSLLQPRHCVRSWKDWDQCGGVNT